MTLAKVGKVWSRNREWEIPDWGQDTYGKHFKIDKAHPFDLHVFPTVTYEQFVQIKNDLHN